MRRRIVLAFGAVAALLLCAAAVKIVTGVGPSLPGPELRRALGFDDITPCPSGFRAVHLPDGVAATSRWRRRGAMPQAVDEPRGVALGRRILVGTGVAVDDDGQRFVSVRQFNAYDPTSGTWRRLPDLPSGLDHPGVAVHDGTIYVVGGYVDGLPSDTFLRYARRTGRWERLPALPTARGALGAAVVGDRLYAVGGGGPYDNPDRRFVVENSFRTVEVFDLRRRTWSEGPALAVARNHVGVAALDGTLYAVGGRNADDGSLDVVERLEPGGTEWTRTVPLPLGVSSLGLVVVDGRIVAFGGSDENERWVTPATWSFDPTNERWRREPDLHEPRHGHAAAAVGSEVFAIGGSPCAGYGVTGSVESLDLSVARR